MGRLTFMLLLLSAVVVNAEVVEVENVYGNGETINSCTDKYGFCNPSKKRVDAGWTHIKEKQCSDKGRCWNESPGKPYCYYPNANKAPDDACQQPCADERVNCGYGPQSECEKKGCCWAPLPFEGKPWCYKKKTVPPPTVGKV